jgi:selenocysteine lyase/cysteine desulfurase
LDLHNAIGKDKVEDRILDLSTYLKDRIVENWGADKLFSPMDRDLSSGLVSFNPFDNPYDSSLTKTIYSTLMNNYNIIVRRVSFKDNASDTSSKQAIRISTHIFNDYDQIDAVVAAIKEIMGGM